MTAPRFSENLAALDTAIRRLRDVRDLLVEAGALRAAAAVRRALKSTEGARRHAELAPYREARIVAKTKGQRRPRFHYYEAGMIVPRDGSRSVKGWTRVDDPRHLMDTKDGACGMARLSGRVAVFHASRAEALAANRF